MSNFIDTLPEEVVGINISSYLSPRTLQTLRQKNDYQEETFQRAAIQDTLEGIDIALEIDDADLLYRIARKSEDFEKIAVRRALPHEKIGHLLINKTATHSFIWTRFLIEALDRQDPKIVQMILDKFGEFIDRPIDVYAGTLEFLAENRQLIESLSKITIVPYLSEPQEYMVLLQLFLDTINKIPSKIYDNAWRFFTSMLGSRMKDVITDEVDNYLRFLLDVRQYVQ